MATPVLVLGSDGCVFRDQGFFKCELFEGQLELKLLLMGLSELVSSLVRLTFVEDFALQCRLEQAIFLLNTFNHAPADFICALHLLF